MCPSEDVRKKIMVSYVHVFFSFWKPNNHIAANVFIHWYAYKYVLLYICTVCIYICNHMHIYIYMCIYIYDTYYTCIHIYMQYATYVYNCMYIYIYIRVCVCSCYIAASVLRSRNCVCQPAWPLRSFGFVVSEPNRIANIQNRLLAGGFKHFCFSII